MSLPRRMSNVEKRAGELTRQVAGLPVRLADTPIAFADIHVRFGVVTTGTGTGMDGVQTPQVYFAGGLGVASIAFGGGDPLAARDEVVWTEDADSDFDESGNVTFKSLSDLPIPEHTLVRLTSNVELRPGMVHQVDGVLIYADFAHIDTELTQYPGFERGSGKVLTAHYAGESPGQFAWTDPTGDGSGEPGPKGDKGDKGDKGGPGDPATGSPSKTIIRGQTTAVVAPANATFQINAVVLLAGSLTPGTAPITIQNIYHQAYEANHSIEAIWRADNSTWEDEAFRDGAVRHVRISDPLEPATIDPATGKLTLGPATTCSIRGLGAGTYDPDRGFAPLRNALLYRVDVPLGEHVDGLAIYDEYGQLIFISPDTDGLIPIRIYQTIPGATEIDANTIQCGQAMAKIMVEVPATNPTRYTIATSQPIVIENIDTDKCEVAASQKYNGFAQRTKTGKLVLFDRFCAPLKM